MEFEAVDEGTIAKILVPEGTDGVKVGAPIAIMAGEGESVERRRRAQGRHRRRLRPPKAPAEPKPDATPKAPPAAGGGRNSARAPAARRAASRRGRSRQGLAARAPARPGAGHRPFVAPGQRPRRPDRPRRRRRRCRQGACCRQPAHRRCRAGARQPPRHARADRTGDPARSGQALQHAQDHRAPPDRIQAAGPAHLSDRRHPARRAARSCAPSSTPASRAAASSSASTTC